jgi:DNA ligase-associated metallophosphoesterase
MSAVVTLAGESVELCAERAAYWRARRTLLVADPHFGKAAPFRALGVPVPRGTTRGTIARLDALLARLAPARLVFLGDFLHAREGRSRETLDAMAAWRAAHGEVEMVLVRGNHDTRAGDPPAEAGIDCVDGPLHEAPFALAHHPTAVAGSYVIAGHVHPCATLVGRGRQRERLACFWIRRERAVLPAFGEFTGCAEVEPAGDDAVWVVAGDDVVRVGPR